MTHTSRVRGVWLLLALLPASGAAQAAPLVYEYVYPYNTPDLIENHVIVLDSSGPEVRGWYYGTSDEFDQGREGYLPGFFVAPMSDLVVSSTTIAFTLELPDRFFTAPVPLAYRDVGDVPAGVLEEWRMSLPAASKTYQGVVRGEEITLDVPGGPRAFHRR